MINFNGTLVAKDVPYLAHANRGLYVGDALFETLRTFAGAPVFWETHYLRLMASMRIMRMEIPMSFTMEFLSDEILKTLAENNLTSQTARVRITVFRKDGGVYTPTDFGVDYIIEATALTAAFYTLDTASYEVELFKDFYVNNDMLSTLKTNNKALHVIAGVFAKENGYDNCLLINQQKHVVEAINGNLFLVKDNTLVCPPLSDGALNGVIRKKIMEIVESIEGYTLEERSISPFELQKADALFITNVIVGIQPISNYRKKVYNQEVAQQLIGKLNAMARLSIMNG